MRLIVFVRALLFAAGFWLGRKLQPRHQCDHTADWQEDLLLQGFAADQVADLSALPPAAQSAISAVAGASAIPRAWLAAAVAQGVPLERLPAAAQAMADAIRSAGRPAVSDAATLAKYRSLAIQAGIAAGGTRADR